MRKCWIRAIGPIIAAMLFAACSVDGDDDENPPTAKTYAYATSANGIYAFSVNTDTGALTEVLGSPFIDGEVPSFIALEPSGKFAYAANESSANISIFAINAPTGALTPVTSSPFATLGSKLFSATIDPSGRFLYTAGWGLDLPPPNDIYHSFVAAYTIDTTTGTLTEVAGSPYLSFYRVFGIAIHPSGRFAYKWVYDGDSSRFSCYAIDAATGALSNIGWVAPHSGSILDIHPSGKFAYIGLPWSESICVHSIDTATGIPACLSLSFRFGDVPWYFTVHPSGKFAYLTGYHFLPDGSNSPPQSMITLSIDTDTGQLAVVSELPPRGGHYSVDPSGKFLYAGHNTISVFAIDDATGVLTEVAGSPLAIKEPLGKLQFICISQ